jgi:thiamine kinase-like enzyme
VSSERLEAVVAAVPELAGRVEAVEDIPGGLVNRSVKVTTAGGVYVVRLFAARSELLQVDRDDEYASTVTAATAGVGAPVVAYLPEHGAMVLEYLEGEAQSDEDLRRGGKHLEVARTLRRLHACPPFHKDFDPFGSLRAYRRMVDAEGLPLPDGYDDYARRASALEAALASQAVALRPCHNDMMPANFIDVGGSLRLIDYEYAANNDPCFDLGCIWAEAGMTPEQLDDMVVEYHGEPRSDQVARARLWAVICDYGWTLWAVLQGAEGGTVGSWDPRRWGEEHFARAVAAFESTEFDTLLASL